MSLGYILSSACRDHNLRLCWHVDPPVTHERSSSSSMGVAESLDLTVTWPPPLLEQPLAKMERQQ